MHVERGHHRCRPDDMRDARADRRLDEFIDDNGHLKDGRASEIVQKHHMRLLFHTSGEPFRHGGHRAPDAVIIDLLDTGLAMDPKTEFGASLGNADFLRRARHRAGVE